MRNEVHVVEAEAETGNKIPVVEAEAEARNEGRAVEAEVEAGRPRRQRPRFARVRQGSMLAIQRLRQRPRFARVRQGSMLAIHTVEAEAKRAEAEVWTYSRQGRNTSYDCKGREV